jgi:hypothetical protein
MRSFSRKNCPLWVVLVSLGPPEIGEKSVAKRSCHIAFKRRYLSYCSFLESTNRIAQIFGIDGR